MGIHWGGLKYLIDELGRAAKRRMDTDEHKARIDDLVALARKYVADAESQEASDELRTGVGR
jgi:hypothetical protein